MIVPNAGIGRAPYAGGIGWIRENLKDYTLVADQRDGVPLVCVDPDVSDAVEDDAVTALENRVGNDDVAQAEGVGRKGLIAASRAFECAQRVKLGLP